MCVCVCVCVCVRERERVCVCVLIISGSLANQIKMCVHNAPGINYSVCVFSAQ